MTIEELKKALIELEEIDDTEARHMEQDDLLLEYINDQEVTDIFNKSTKWYA